MSRNELFLNKCDSVFRFFHQSSAVLSSPRKRGSGNFRFPLKACGNDTIHVFKIVCFFLSLFLSVSIFAFAKTETPKPTVTQTNQNGDVKKSAQKPVAEVTVIASRLPSFQQKLNDMPSNITYKDKTELNKTHPATFQDAVRDTEGAIFYDQVGNGVDTTFSLRGFNEGNAVTFIVDGVRVNEVDGDAVNYPLVSMNDIESIQIERGSSSAIYGSNAFAGVVNITTRKPSAKKISVFGGVELSSFMGIKFNQGISGSIPDKITPLNGKWTYYFNGGRDLNQGFRADGDWRITNFDIKTGYELADSQGGVRVGVKHVVDAISNPGFLTIPEYHADSMQTKNPLDGRKFDNTIVQISADKKFLDDRITASLMNNWRYNLIKFYTTARTMADGAFNPDTDLTTTRSRATDLVWLLGYSDRWDWVGNDTLLGMEFRDAAQYDLEQDAFQGIVVDNSPAETNRNAKPRSGALFWRQNVSFFDRINFHYGMRHDYVWLKNQDKVAPVNNFSKRWNDSTLSTGVALKPWSLADFFWNYSQGFRAPAISDLAPWSEWGGSGVSYNLAPGKSDRYEAGTRLRFHPRANVKLGYFLIDMKNEIAFSLGVGENINIGRTRRYGTEFRLDTNPIEEMIFYGVHTWTNAYVREIDDNFNQTVDGRTIGMIPEQQFVFGTTAKPFKRLGEYWDKFEIGMNGTLTGKQHPVGFESSTEARLDSTSHWIKAYQIWNFICQYEFHGIQTYFKINNIFDQRYYNRAIAASNSAFSPSSLTPPGTHYFVTPGAPREFVIGTKWEF